MKRTYWSGVAVVALALAAMCRPAAADTLVYSLTASTLESILAANSSTGTASCTSLSNTYSTMCGTFFIEAVPNLSEATISSVDSPIPSGVGAWADQVVQYSANVQAVEFYANFSSSTDDITFLTNNANVKGNTFTLGQPVPPGNLVSGLTATAPMPGSDLFSFTVNTTVGGVQLDNVSWTIILKEDELYASGAQGDKSTGAVERNVILTPEPSSVLPCLMGIVVLGLHKKRRWLAACWNRRL